MSDAADPVEPENPAAIHYQCECGELEPTMDHFVEHVAANHEALDIAVQALLRDQIEVTPNDE